MARLESIYRYPVKGLSPEQLDRASLTAGAYFPGDRLYAIENGPSGFDPAAPVHQPKTKFLMLMRNERLATLRTHYDDATGTLSIHQDSREAARGDLATKEGRLAIEAFFRRFMPTTCAARRRCCSARGPQLLGCRARAARLDHQPRLGRRARNHQSALPVHPLRFRAQPLCRGLAGLARVRPASAASSPSAPRG